MSQWDLTAKMAPYLDRHLMIPLLAFLTEKKYIYDESDLDRVKLDLLKGTKMVDFRMDVHKKIYRVQEVPQELKEERQGVVDKFKKLQEETQPILKIFMEPEVSRQMQNSRDSKQLLEYLQKNNFKNEMIDTCYNFAKFQYECGMYSGAAEYLYFHRILVQPTDRNYLNGLWGKLASEILKPDQDWDTALDELKHLQAFIDDWTFGSSLQTLQQRTWLIHWSLFVFFNHPKGKDLIIEMFLYQKQYLNAIQTICPWILRYLATAVIIRGSRRNVMKDLVKVIQEEAYTYCDPITCFVEDLYVKFDFGGAQQKLRECKTVLDNDFFLVACLDDFFENARLMIFETFCRIHQCISIGMLAEKLNMTPDEAERWIVNLIRNAKLDAKIDSKLGHVVMGTQTSSPYQQLIEKTKAISFRSQMLQMNVEKKKKLQEQPNWGNDGF